MGNPLRRMFLTLFLPVCCAASLAANLPTGFEQVLVRGNLGSPISMTFAPDGRLFVCDKYGKVLIIKNGVLLNTPFLEVNTVQDGERGLQGIAFDPNFATNRYVYVFYTAASGPQNRISRFSASSANPDIADSGSEVVLVDNIATNNFHNGGALHFGIDGKLYAATGDAQTPSRAQSKERLEGKILRLDPASYPNIIPTDNPFVGNGTARGEIWALGLRNPFTFAIDPVNGKMFINDVGASAWEEVNLGERGANYGWSNCEGACSNTNYRNPTHTYDHNTGQCVAGGAFYRGNQFPASYVGDYFFADFTANWIRRISHVDNSVSVFATAVNAGPIDLDVGPDGSLYYLSLSTSSTDPARYDGKIFKISYFAGGNRSPMAVASANPISGPAPLQVNFSGAGSTDPDGDPLSYQWSFGDGSPTANGREVTHVYLNNGQYAAQLTVNDGRGGSSESEILQIKVGKPPVATINLPFDGTFYAAGDTILYDGTATDPDEGILPPGALNWVMVFHHDDHSHPFLGPFNGVNGGSFVIPRTGETADNVLYRISLTATDSDGLTHTVSRDVLPRKSTFTLNSEPPGLQIVLDGQPMTTPLSRLAVVGLTRSIAAPSPQMLNGNVYEFIAWSDSGDQSHAFDVPETDTTFLATYRLVPGSATFNFLPTDDAYVKMSSPTTTTGSSNTLRVRKTSSEMLYSFLKFSLIGLNGQVSRATLRLYVVDASSDGGSLYSVSNDYEGTTIPWTQSGLKWSNAPLIGGEPWSRVGSVAAGNWVEFDVSAAITGDGIYSFGLKNNASDVVQYTSKEGSNKPALIVQTSGGTPTPPPTISSFIPTSGAVGTEVTILGNNLSGATSVQFNGVAATALHVDSNEQIRANVPSGATTGKLRVTTSSGTAASMNDFTVNPGGNTTALTFPVNHDAYVKASSASSNYGSTATLRVRKSSSETLMTYLKFEVAGMIGPVESATLRLYVADAGSDGGSIYPASNNYQGTTTAWVQSGLNWNNAPAISGAPLSSIGAVAVGSWVEVNVTPAITGNGVFSFAIKSNASDAVYFGSRESSNKPELVVRGSFNARVLASPIADEIAAPRPKVFALHQNYPNPFNPETRIAYDLPESADVRLSVYNTLGQQVIVLVDDEQPGGSHAVAWDGRDQAGQYVGSGIYFFRLQAGALVASRKMLMLR